MHFIYHKVEDEKTRQKRIQDWRDRFKHMHFYFDGLNLPSVIRVSGKIRELGGVIYMFILISDH